MRRRDFLAELLARRLLGRLPHASQNGYRESVLAFGQDQVVDEIAINFTHTQQIDWLLPGVPATGKMLKWPSR